jgi:hypothetical protein
MKPDHDPQLEACRAYARMMNTLDVSHIIPFLSDDVKYTSQWVFSEINGKQEYLNYIEPKLQTIQKSGSLVWAELAYTNVFGAGHCIVMAQGQKEKAIATLLIKMNGDRISEIAMCQIPSPAECQRTGQYPK